MARNVEQIEAEASEHHGRAHVNFSEIAWRRRSLLALGVLVGLVLGALYYAMRTPAYRSDAQVLLIKKQPDAFPITGADPRLAYYEDYLSTHQVLIKSPLIVGRAVKKRELQGLESFAGLADPTKAIIRSLAVSREFKESAGSSNILNLSFRGKVADECATVLNAVIGSYKDFLDETYKNVSDDTLELITKAKDVLLKDLLKKEADYRDFRQQAPLLWKGKDGSSLHQEKLGRIESKRATLLVRRAEIQGRLASVDKALREGRSRAALLTILPELSSSAAPDAAKRSFPTTSQEQLLPLLHQEQVLLEDYGPNHPHVQSIRKRIELTRKFLAQPPGGVAELDKSRDGLLLDPMEVYIQSLKQELQDIQMSEQLLAAQFQSAYDEARKLTNYEIQDDVFRGDIARTRLLYDSIINRLREVNLVRDFGGTDARTIAPAGPGLRVEPNAFPVFTAAALLGILGGFVLAYVAERTDESFRTPDEVRRRLGLPIMGHIPMLKQTDEAPQEASPEDAAADPLLWAYHRPQSREAESYRGVRTALYFSMNGKEHRVVQITSPDMGDGKTALTANLGVSIAQSGKKTLLVDADFRRPRLHKLFGLSAQVGLATVIQGEAELKEAIQESHGLSVLACGAVSSNPAELLTSPRFQELLDAIRAQYDFVLVDTPPLLAVTDPCVVAPRVDGVLLTIRISKNGRSNAFRASEILATLGVTVLGVVVNGVDRHAGAGGYGCGYGQPRRTRWFSRFWL